MVRDNMNRIKRNIKMASRRQMSEKEVLEKEIDKWLSSGKREMILAGERYYESEHDILNKKRTVIGRDGKREIVMNLPNNRIINNQFAKVVDQKANYLLGKPLTFSCINKDYLKEVNEVCGMKFLRMLKNAGTESIASGVSYIYVYYDDKGSLRFKKLKSSQILPFWRDEEHSELEMAVRIYDDRYYSGKDEEVMQRVEVYTLQGIKRYIRENGKLISDTDSKEDSYISYNEKGYNWDRLPIVAFKYNARELGLIKKIKPLQDALNDIYSEFMDNMQEDNRSSILVIKNYDGTDLGEFRHNLATYGAIKVRSDTDGRGGVETLKIDVDSANYKTIIELLKKAIIDTACGYDASDDRLGSSPNQMNIQSMYSDIELDTNGMEMEFSTSMEDIMWFVGNHLLNTKQLKKESVKAIFNRDMIVNESEKIDNCIKSKDLLSSETIMSKHPWVRDVGEEIKKIDFALEK